MKIALLAFLLSSTVLLFCTQQITVEGYLQLFGTAHFPRPVLVSDHQERYRLEMEAGVLDTLLSGTTRRIRITGEIRPCAGDGSRSNCLKVKKWEWISPDGTGKKPAEAGSQKGRKQE